MTIDTIVQYVAPVALFAMMLYLVYGISRISKRMREI